MPIKLPKAFPRRKSSGNALEELTNPPEPSFRVFERPDRKSFDGGNTLKRMSQGRPLSAGHNLGSSLYTDGGNPNFSNRYVASEEQSLAMLTVVSGSGGTNNSSSSGGHDNSSSSARFSSSSTLPSSTDIPLDDKPLPHPHETHRFPPPPVPATHPLSLRTGGRAFSFGRKKPQSPSSGSPITQPPQVYGRSEDSGIYGRDRALTESSYASGSTVTPPKLLDTSLDLGSSDLDSFGDMFENFGKRRSTLGVDAAGLGVITGTESPGGLGSVDTVGIIKAQTSPAGISPTPVPRSLTTPYFGERSSFTPSPIQIDRSRNIREAQSSPYSWTSHGSHDGLMDSPGLGSADHAHGYKDDPHIPRSAAGSTSASPMPTTVTNSPSNRKQQQRQSSYGAGLRRTSAYASRRDSIPLQDEDAKLVMDSIHASRRLNRHSGESEEQNFYKGIEKGSESTQPFESLLGTTRHTSSPRNLSPERQQNYEHRPHVPIGLFDTNESTSSESSRRLGSNETTPRAKTSELANQEKRSSLFDASLHPPPRAGLSPAAGDQTAKAGPVNKVMTPAQFERYRKEQEIARNQNNVSRADDSDDDSDHYEDDDETERAQELAKQRRKQEAHLAVYRQQMMKVTGEQPSKLPDLGPLRPPVERASASAPNIYQPGPAPTLTINKASVSGKASDDEDDEIPLGVLAAHGFPNKNRPPGTSVNGSIRYTSESYPPPPMSTAGMSAAGGPRGLPAFAKNLPPDPYYGAGLVNQSNREMPSFGNHVSGSQYGGASPNLHPGGLVGVIAGEERAKAMRRGSPNAQGNYGSPLPPGMTQVAPGPPSMISPGDEAQIQMSHQMTQMMQMQMQWMQSMQQMMGAGMQPPQPGQMQPGMPPMPPPHGQLPVNSNNFLSAQGQMVRPMSHSAPSTPSMVQQQQQRAMSMMSHNLSPQWPPRNTASPSMLNGAYGPQGYAPSIAPSERSNIGQPSRYRPVSVAPIDEHSRPISRSSNNLLGPGPGDRKSTLTVSSGGKTSPVPPKKVPSDDDDDEGWEEMKKKREQKASTWRMKRKDGNGLKELYYPGT
ncbi:MAG: hypothetical protein L6R41_000006 [Letrouitia leprolyta]|nr:MAG: hypothetical protein L6R41_000006 [Letrouitia leprolyta]